ncbi:VirB4 family type IV secretion/conjugal transfer ATPase [Agrobacterium pusense]|uniref:VirB4 family type IV secretion/conjugal transfer ATPase n=1 Tax=Agrobacterium pusense TaxID=648995 RepID=UPI000888C416|nr:VirB4 family type IV secretion/conjugal transfer ATPase [Agrobacterium pusense]OOO23171.1 ATPase [Agrobacterium pusense]WKD47873.1 VirB4 family type IV secretion/conjugal transfer ATPase [Agrobacterium pusense]SDF53849.1 type IV secretion system protein VirB4 [Agrobacterium pusense]
MGTTARSLKGSLSKGWQIFADRGISTHVPFYVPIENGIIRLKNDCLVSTLRLTGFSFETADIETINILQRQRNAAFRAISSIGSFALYTHVVRRKVTPSLPATFTDPFIQRLDDVYQASISRNEMFVNDTYISLVVRPLFKRGSALSRIMGIGGDVVRKELLRSIRDKLVEATKALEKSLAAYGPKVLRDVQRVQVDLGNGKTIYRDFFENMELDEGTPKAWFSEQCEFFYTLLNGARVRPIRLGNLPVDAMLPARRTSIGNRTIHLQGETSGDDRYAAMVSLKEYPPETGAGMLDYILKLPFEMVLTQSMSFIDDIAARSRIERLDRQLSKADEGGSSVQASLDIARDELARKRVAFAEHHLTVMPIATSPAQLDDAVALIGNELGALGASYVREDLNAEPAYWAQLPGNQAYIARRAVISTLNCAGLSSFHAYPYGKPDGNHWGPAITIFETTSGTPFFFNFHQGDVGHTTVFGPTGSGKTVIMAFLILQAYRVSPRLKTIVFDKDRGLDIMVRAAGGTYLTLEPGEPSGWNPLLLDDTKENRVFLYQLLSFMLKPSKEGESLTPQEETIIRTAIKSVLKTKDRSYRRLSSLRALLAGTERTEGSLIARLDKWVDHGPYAWLFDNPDDNLDISRPMIGFDMTSILDDPPVRTAALLYMFHRLDEVYDGKAPIINLMDEAWKLLDDDEFKRTMKDYFKTIRKRNGLVIFGTQSADDVVQSSVSRTIIEQTSTNIFFANPKADENSYMEHFGLSRAEFDWVKNGDPASRFMLIKHAKSSVIARVDMSHMPEFIKVLSGREETVREVEMLREEYGDDPKNWLSKFCDWEGDASDDQRKAS